MSHCHDDHCHSDSCCSSHSSAGCGCGCSKCCCDAHKKECCGPEHPDFAKKLLELADCAWMELLKEKIKEKIKANGNNHLDQLAETISNANQERWKRKMAKQKSCQDFHEKISSLLCCDDGKCTR